jgi:hypothetical protein
MYSNDKQQVWLFIKLNFWFHKCSKLVELFDERNVHHADHNFKPNKDQCVSFIFLFIKYGFVVTDQMKFIL